MAIEILNNGGAEKVKINGERVREKLELKTWFYKPPLELLDIGMTVKDDKYPGVIVDKNNDIYYILMNKKSFYGAHDYSIKGHALGTYASYQNTGFDMIYVAENNCCYILVEGAYGYFDGRTNCDVNNKLFRFNITKNTLEELYHNEISVDPTAFSNITDYNNHIANLPENFFNKGRLAFINNKLYCLTLLNNTMQCTIREFNFNNKTWTVKHTINGLGVPNISFSGQGTVFEFKDEIIILSSDPTRTYSFNAVQNKQGRWRTFYDVEGNEVNVSDISKHFVLNTDKEVYYIKEITNDKIIIDKFTTLKTDSNNNTTVLSSGKTAFPKVYDQGYGFLGHFNYWLYKFPILYKKD